MTDPLASIWERCDAEDARINGDEVMAWDDGVIDQFTAAGLVSRVENARCIQCDACAEHHDEEITYIKSPKGSETRAYIDCLEHGRVVVKLERLREWAVDFGGLSRVAATGLDLAGDIEEVTSERLWYLGKRTIGGRSRDIFLARGTTWMDAPSVFGSCARLNAAKGALLFVPGVMPPEEVWTGDPPRVIPLRLVARLEGRSIVFDQDHIESLLTQKRRLAPIKAQESFPTPPGTAWRDVMVWVSDFTVTIEALRRNRSYSFQAAGFEEIRIVAETSFGLKLMANDPTAGALAETVGLSPEDAARAASSALSVSVFALKPGGPS